MTLDDLDDMKEVIDTTSDISLSPKKNHNGNPVIIFKKIEPNGVILCEEYRAGKKELELQTAYRMKRKRQPLGVQDELPANVQNGVAPKKETSNLASDSKLSLNPGRSLGLTITHVGENLKSFFTDFKDGATSLFVGDQTKAMKGEGGIISGTIQQILNPVDTVRNMQIAGGIAEAFNSKYGNGAAKYNALTGNLWINQDMNMTKLNFNELTEELQKKIKKQAEEGYDVKELYGGQVYNFPQINDGIISPSGRVTKIASDDWVFAAKNLGDMASAFIPPSIANTTNNAPSTYAITQNFSFSGSTRDIASMVQREAFNGTQSAITASMMQSNQRLQLMSGLR